MDSAEHGAVGGRETAGVCCIDEEIGRKPERQPEPSFEGLESE